ncbi:MAG: phage portal protein [Bacteroidales bacterium]|nr:phage portal protein [Bacteroidales bacterium]
MPNINEIIGSATMSPADQILALKEKPVRIPPWFGQGGLFNEYDPMQHPVMQKSIYPDAVRPDGGLEKVTRITYDLQRLATKRMTELVCGIPVRRVFRPQNDRQAEVAKWLEAIFTRNRIDSVNIERCNMLFAGCEVMTLWYAVESANNLYGFDSRLKLRCRNFSPMLGDGLYPMFDEYGDMVAMSVEYTRKVGGQPVVYFDTYTADRHVKYSNAGGDFAIVEDEHITVGKIPAVYCYRPTPIWESTSDIVYEMEWAMSRNGNYLRRNSKPLFVVFADEQIRYGDEKDEKKEFRAVLQYPKGSTAQYVTWQQAVENLKFHTSELRQTFFTQLQLPDWSYEKMSQQALSGESRKQLFIDCQLKVKDESGRLLEYFDREVNVVKAFLKAACPSGYEADIDALPFEVEITPFTVDDDKDTINNLMTANGGRPLMSQRESIEQLGWSNDVEKTMKEIADDEKGDAFEQYE